MENRRSPPPAPGEARIRVRKIVENIVKRPGSSEVSPSTEAEAQEVKLPNTSWSPEQGPRVFESPDFDPVVRILFVSAVPVGREDLHFEAEVLEPTTDSFGVPFNACVYSPPRVGKNGANNCHSVSFQRRFANPATQCVTRIWQPLPEGVSSVGIIRPILKHRHYTIPAPKQARFASRALGQPARSSEPQTCSRFHVD